MSFFVATRYTQPNEPFIYKRINEQYCVLTIRGGGIGITCVQKFGLFGCHDWRVEQLRNLGSGTVRNLSVRTLTESQRLSAAINFTNRSDQLGACNAGLALDSVVMAFGFDPGR